MPGPNRWHPDTTYAGTYYPVQVVNAHGEFQASVSPPSTSLGGLTYRASDGIFLIILPTSDPHQTGCLWNNAGTVTISAG